MQTFDIINLKKVLFTVTIPNVRVNPTILFNVKYCATTKPLTVNTIFRAYNKLCYIFYIVNVIKTVWS